MTFSNPLLKSWAERKATLGVWCVLPGAIHAEFIARQGPDYVCVDCQHGLYDHSMAVAMMQGITAGGSIPLARARWNEPHAIMSLLDAGAYGVVVPMVETAAEAERAVAACRYAPAGIRSFGPIRSREVFGSNRPTDLELVACIVMIESQAGLENARAIAMTKGVHAIYIGPVDLAIAMGLDFAAARSDPRFQAALNAIVDACRQAGIGVGIAAPNGQLARTYREQGFDLIGVSMDSTILMAGVRAQLDAARTATETVPP